MKRKKEPALTRQAWLNELGRQLVWYFPAAQVKDIRCVRSFGGVGKLYPAPLLFHLVWVSWLQFTTSYPLYASLFLC